MRKTKDNRRQGASGKGDKRRPLLVSRKEFESNWDAAFRAQARKIADEKRIDSFDRWYANPANRINLWDLTDDNDAKDAMRRAFNAGRMSR